MNRTQPRALIDSIAVRICACICVFTATASACGNDVDLNGDVSQGAFASINIKPDSSCVYSPDGASIASGLYDISEGSRSGSTGCRDPYRVNFLVESEVEEAVLFQQATVTLTTPDGDMLTFDDSEEGLPNPFEVITSGRVDDETGKGVVQINAIPTAYAPYLAEFVGAEVVIEARMEGRTPSDKRIATQSVRFSVEICDSCLSQCASALAGPGALRREDFAMDECDDNAGADGRICWDPDC